jgi:hypothetical protein
MSQDRRKHNDCQKSRKEGGNENTIEKSRRAVGVINAVKMWYQRHDANANNSSRSQWKLHNPIGLSVSRHGWSASRDSQWGSKKLKADHTKASAILFFSGGAF